MWVMPAQVLALFYTTLMFSQLEVVLTASACFWQYVGRGWVQGFGHSLVYTRVLQWVPIPMGKWVGNGYGLGRMGGYEGPGLYND